MYPYQERLRALKLYLRLGKRCKATIHQIEELDASIRSYNEKRIKHSLGYLSPIEYREGLGLVT